MIKNKVERRETGAVLVVVGGALMWLAPEKALVGAVLLVAGMALELRGITHKHGHRNSAGG